MKLALLFIVFILIGYFIFSDSIKKRFFKIDLPVLNMKVQKPAPDYTDEDRKRLDSILKEVNP